MDRRIAAGLVALALAFPLAASAQAGAADLRGQIAKMDRAWETAYNAGDAAALAALYSEDAKVLAPGGAPASGRAAIQAMFTQAVTAGSKNTVTLEEVFGGGDYAIEVGGWTATGANGAHLDHGTFITVYKKVGGDWKIFRDTWNSSMTR